MEKLSNDEVAEIVFNEGVGYAVACYMSSDSIVDPKLAKLWDEADLALNNLTEYLFPNGEEKWADDYYKEKS